MDTRVAAVKRNFVWWGTAVLLIAAIFRLFMLHDVPPGLSQDEVLNADIVQFIRGGYHALFFREGYGHEGDQLVSFAPIPNEEEPEGEGDAETAGGGADSSPTPNPTPKPENG
jgi:hypothetical protein